MSPVAPKYWGKPLGPHKVGAYGGWLACVIVYVGDVFTDYEQNQQMRDCVLMLNDELSSVLHELSLCNIVTLQQIVL